MADDDDGAPLDGELALLLRAAVKRCRACRPPDRCSACQLALAALDRRPVRRPPRLPAPVAPRMTRCP